MEPVSWRLCVSIRAMLLVGRWLMSDPELIAQSTMILSENPLRKTQNSVGIMLRTSFLTLLFIIGGLLVLPYVNTSRGELKAQTSSDQSGEEAQFRSAAQEVLVDVAVTD